MTEGLNIALALTAAFVSGGALGLLYFLGLWATVRQLPALRWAPLWLLASLVLRLALLLAGLYWIGGADWRRFVAALLGIILMRLLVTRRLGVSPAGALPKPSNRSAK